MVEREITLRRQWNNSLMLHIRECTITARREIEARVRANKEVIAELEALA
jgi:hypothetical protein